ncbi:ADP-ribosylation factor GTPase-activating protein 3 isoform X1 [Marmota marmota marmota]|uniref:ADP-ribosylation factor GTPase-activating protein 3 isoform X1 n=1 Tax=Marmota marmota marmota TaxID=9994 RepID=UPI002093E318|nr:ADP-ribosylation factor GTPase-activating protein 3 isoform X1 [Marmota marmota marmota]
MQVGGNANASSFFHQHGCATNDTNAKYNSRAAQLYRERVKSLASQATRKHGTDLWLDSCVAPPLSPSPKEEDFFASHVSPEVSTTMQPSAQPEPAPLGPRATEATPENKEGGPEQGPSVEGLNAPAKAAVEVSSIIKKKPNQAKRGLGAKKGSLGAQKLANTCFTEIEKQAQAVDKMKEQEDLARVAPKEESIVSSLRLAYKDLEIQMKKDEKMNLSGRRKADAERLGMGLGNCRSGISHSVTSDMQTIEQESPTLAKPRKKYHEDSEDSYFTSSSRYFDDPMELRGSSLSSWDDNADSYWKKESSKDSEAVVKGAASSDRATARRKPDYEPTESTDEAQKKFGNVKAISSDMYFGRQAQADYESRARLERLAASSSISSADLFEEQRKQTAGAPRLLAAVPFRGGRTEWEMRVSTLASLLLQCLWSLPGSMANGDMDCHGLGPAWERGAQAQVTECRKLQPLQRAAQRPRHGAVQAGREVCGWKAVCVCQRSDDFHPGSLWLLIPRSGSALPGEIASSHGPVTASQAAIKTRHTSFQDCFATFSHGIYTLLIFSISF